jgi:hypothetical protein
MFRGFVEKLTVAQVVKELTVLRSTKVCCRVQRNPPLDLF